MNNIKFARVDDRLIHGQVATAWSNSVGINSIYVVDDATANDPFTKTLYTALQNNYSFKILVLTAEELVEKYRKSDFGKDKVMLLFKNIEHAHRVINKGVELQSLNIGNVPKREETQTITDFVALKKEEYEMLKQLELEKSVEIYFQAMPSFGKKKFSEVKWND